MTNPLRKEPPGRTSGISTRAFAFGLLALLVLSYPGLWSGGRSLFFRDFGTLAYPVVQYHREAFWRGEFPLWNPLSHSGTPFFAQWNTLAGYPLSLFYLLLPPPWSLNVFCLLHIALAGIGMFRLAKGWTGDSRASAFAGVAYAFGGGLLSSHIYPNYLVALAWWPWVILSTRQALNLGGLHVLLAGSIGALQMLSGAPELLWQTWALATVLLVVRVIQADEKPWILLARFLVVVLLVTGLTAFQLVPFLDLLRSSQRDATYATALWTLPISGWANWLVPLFHSFETPQGFMAQAGQAFLPTYYCGVGTILLACAAFRTTTLRLEVITLSLFAILTLVMAAGDATPLPGILKTLFPPLAIVRFPVKFLYTAVFTLPLLAAVGFAWANAITPERRQPTVKTLVVLTGALVFASIVIVLVAKTHPTPGESQTRTARSAATSILFLTVSCATLALYLRSASHQLRAICFTSLLLVVWLDVQTHAPHIVPTLPSEVYLGRVCEANPPPHAGQARLFTSPAAERLLLTRMLPNLTNDFLGSRLAAWSNLNLLEGLPKVNGAMTLQVREQAQLEKLIYTAENPPADGLLDLLAVSHISAPNSPVEWIQRPSHPAWLTIGPAPTFLDSADILPALLRPGFNPRASVLLAKGTPVGTVVGPVPSAQILRQVVSAQHVDAEVQTPAATLLVISQTLTRGWKAFLDDRPTPLLRANHAFQTLVVPTGRHRIRLVYEEPGLLWGGIVSLVTLVGIALAAVRLTYRRARTAESLNQFTPSRSTSPETNRTACPDQART